MSQFVRYGAESKDPEELQQQVLLQEDRNRRRRSRGCVLSSCAETLGVTVKITQENSILLKVELFDSEVKRVDLDKGQSE